LRFVGDRAVIAVSNMYSYDGPTSKPEEGFRCCDLELKFKIWLEEEVCHMSVPPKGAVIPISAEM
jgi:hypothetical protein